MSHEPRSDVKPYDVFIKGEIIDLVTPCERAIDVDGWHLWFNDPEVTRYSDYGLFPNTAETQREYLSDLLKPGSKRLALLILPKRSERVVGIVSLSNINTIHRSGETAVIIGERTSAEGALFYGLEAKARITEHAFEIMGLERVSGSQALPLADWQQYQLLFGFRPEGIKRRAHRRGYDVYDSVISSCTLEDYLAVKRARNGAYWPGREKLLELIRKLPKESVVERVANAIDRAIEDYMKAVELN